MSQIPDVIQRMAEERGLTVLQCGPGHWHIRGGEFLVNYYPDTRTIYLAGTTKGHRGSWSKAFDAADLPPDMPRKDRDERRDRAYNRRHRRQLLEHHPYCLYCGGGLDSDTATLEHVVPLSKGGLNHPNNFKLACHDCNQKRNEELMKRSQKNGK